MERALIAIGREEIKSLIRESGGTVVTCEFCRKTYPLTGEELARLATEM